jgi:hypothetical protein
MSKWNISTIFKSQTILNMTIILKKGMSMEEVDKQILNSKTKRKLHNFDKYVGVLKLKEDPMTIQKAMRDEWE